MTRFEEIICSSETARVFMSVCDVGKTGFTAWLYDWQTLIAGGLALCAALITTFFLFNQIDIQKSALKAQVEKDNRELDQQRKAALIQVPHALAEIGLYITDCYAGWQKQDLTKCPKAPKDAIKVLMTAAPYANSNSFKSFQILIVNLQIFETRIMAANLKNNEDALRMMGVDLAVLAYLNARLFNYARFIELEIPYTEPTYDELKTAMIEKFGGFFHYDSKLRDRFEEGLRKHFETQK